MISSSSNSPTAVLSQLVIADMQGGNFNSASAISTLIFLLIFAVAFIMVKFLGADVAGTQNMPKTAGKKKWWSLRRQEDATGDPDGQDAGQDGPADAASSPDAGTEKEVTR
jgi:multiple sugar transport system permease protein